MCLDHTAFIKGVINKLFNSYINDSNFTIYGDGTSTEIIFM